MSQSARRLSGWAAFTLEQQQLQEHASKKDGDSFPPILSNNPKAKAGPSESLLSGKPLARPYSFVIQPCAENGRIPVSGGCASEEAFIAMDDKIDPVNSLKKLHSWADEGLIRDILSAVENDEDQASSLLSAMSFSKSKRSETPFPESSSFVNDQFFQEGLKQGGSLDVNNLPLGGTQERVSDGNVLSVPLEPEWEEDDVYMRHRKEALRMRRLASQHSRAASNAYMKGDHFSAHQLSKKARELWSASDKLNNKAAKEILLVRNGKSEPWKLDLHGLHASEAIHALKEFLHVFEAEKKPNEVTNDKSGSSSSSFSMVNGILKDAIGDKHLLSRGRPITVEIITGSGTHSKGQAALPSAVRSFLIENGYRFDEARTGVFVVLPKFRK